MRDALDQRTCAIADADDRDVDVRAFGVMEAHSAATFSEGRGAERSIIRPQKSAKIAGSRGGLVWCGSMPRRSGVKQKVTVVEKSSSASICWSNQSSQPS